MSNDIMDGFMAAIPEKFRDRFQLIPEYIHQGNTELVKIALNKFIQFSNLDVVTGIISYQLIPEIVKILENKRKLGFFFDFGEYIQPLEPLPQNLVFNSLKMWQQQFALGKWAQQNFGGKGALLTSVYDAGFHLHSSFWQGAITGGAQEIDLHTIPFSEDNSMVADNLPRFFDKIEKAKVDYLHALFCGNEALNFFNAFRNSSLNGKIPLVVSSHMASDEILQKINNLSLNFYSASGWDYYNDSPVNTQFKKDYEFLSGRKASVFATLGYEMGQILLPTLPNWERNEFEAVLSLIEKQTINSPRGELNFSYAGSFVAEHVHIEKITLPNIASGKTLIARDKSISYSNNVLQNIHHESVSGWKNPYLCI